MNGTSKRAMDIKNLGFILAAAGSAIGLGAILEIPLRCREFWRRSIFFHLFAFYKSLLVYPFCLQNLQLGAVPNRMLSRPIGSLHQEHPWYWIGKMGIAASFILLSFYSVVGGWIIIYLFQGLSGGLSGLIETEYGNLFEDLISNSFITVGARIHLYDYNDLDCCKGCTKRN